LASLAVIIGFLQLIATLYPASPSNSISPDDQAYDALLKQVKTEIAMKQDKGALIVYTIPEMQGELIEISDLQTQTRIAATTISRHTTEGHSIYAAVVSLQPGNYIVQSPTATRIVDARTVVTISPEKVVSVIWRKTYE
jgi:hypothetical protein